MRGTGFADLHLHTTRSDGADELVAKAAAVGCSVVAITDHDTVEGFAEAATAGERLSVEVIPGIEISTNIGDTSVHILGYFVDPTAPRLRSLTEGGRALRWRRMEKMIRKLKGLGYPLHGDELADFVGDAVPGRAHLARFLVKKGHFGHIEAVFNKVLGDGCPAYEPVRRLTPEEAIAVIAEAGGASVLAHPGLTGVDGKIDALAAAGLDGLEVYSGRHGEKQIMRYLTMAKRLGLLVTGGSDHHGGGSGTCGIGSVKLPLTRVEALRDRAARQAA